MRRKMISDKYRCIYIHPVKCGGITIETILGDETANASYGRHTGIRHAGAKFYKNSFPKKFESYFIFASARNPWDRVVSRYFSFLEGRNYHNPKVRKEIVSHSFNEAVKHSSLVKRMHSVCSKISVKGTAVTDEIIHFNNYEEDLRKALLKIGIDCIDIPHKNKSEHKSYHEYYNDESRRIVSEFFRDDIKYFGYEYGEK